MVLGDLFNIIVLYVCISWTVSRNLYTAKYLLCPLRKVLDSQLILSHPTIMQSDFRWLCFSGWIEFRALSKRLRFCSCSDAILYHLVCHYFLPTWISLFPIHLIFNFCHFPKWLYTTLIMRAAQFSFSITTEKYICTFTTYRFIWMCLDDI